MSNFDKEQDSECKILQAAYITSTVCMSLENLFQIRKPVELIKTSLYTAKVYIQTMTLPQKRYTLDFVMTIGRHIEGE